MYAYTWGNPLRYVYSDGRAVNLALAGTGAAKAINLHAKPKTPYPLSSAKRTLQRNARLRAWEQARKRLEFRGSAFSASVGAVVMNVAAQIQTAYNNLLNNRAFDWLQLQPMSDCSDTWDPNANTLHGCR